MKPQLKFYKDWLQIVIRNMHKKSVLEMLDDSLADEIKSKILVWVLPQKFLLTLSLPVILSKSIQRSDSVWFI